VAGIAAPVDGVTASFDDPARVQADTLRARALGFGAKLCIHPKQVGPVHQAFAPTADELDWAARVVAAAEAAQGGAVAVDGRMVDRPVILIAQQMLEEARRRK
jgi:citrate lyase subunit beta/citryl-CoA lyase